MKAGLDLLLVVMPFGSVCEPPLGVSLLKAAAGAAGFSAGVRHFQLDFAALVGPDRCGIVPSAMGSGSLAGDWIFAEALFGEKTPDPQRYLDQLVEDYGRRDDGVYYGVDFGEGRNFLSCLREEIIPLLQSLRAEASGFVARCAEEILTLRPRVVGFSISCHQACACLAVARRLKEAERPPVALVGGPSCHGDMARQWVRSFPWVDYVCAGEGDEVVPELLGRLLSDDDVEPPPGVLRRGSDRNALVVPRVADLNRLPLPDFSDYFEQRERILGPLPARRALPLETSRGCWWGEKSQCAFCGDVPGLVAYRSKSPERVLRELHDLTEAYACRSVLLVDDVLDRRYPEQVFAALKAEGSPLALSAQVRADMTRADLRALRAAGMRQIQPGIESLSDSVLRLMHKGTSRLRNLRFLRWAREMEMAVAWNILYGFTGESESEYVELAREIPLFVHLQPPCGVVWIALKRFSPYWREPDRYGLKDVRPSPSYACIYPFPEADLRNLAFFFDYEYVEPRQPLEYSRPLRQAVGDWLRLWEAPEALLPKLTGSREGDAVVVSDTRPCARAASHHLDGAASEVLLCCDAGHTRAWLHRRLASRWAAAAVDVALDDLQAAGLVVPAGRSFLSLVVFREHASPVPTD